MRMAQERFTKADRSCYRLSFSCCCLAYHSARPLLLYSSSLPVSYCTCLSIFISSRCRLEFLAKVAGVRSTTRLPWITAYLPASAWISGLTGGW